MLKRIINRIAGQFARDEFTSLSLRKEFRERFDVEVGLYSYGCFDHTRIGRETRIGRYCSVAPTAHIFRRNHGIEFLGLTPYLYNANLGVVKADTIANLPLEISDDVWLGHNSTILPSVSKIGRGAIIAAGSVVTSNVEPYSIVAGNPAKQIRVRFSDDIIEKIEATSWWLMSPEEIKSALEKDEELFFSPASFFSK